ncbi:hypothetical protein, conserved [Trypanosoma cruzi]|uniref:Kinesin light chain n=2 Tax=Trypanosoma cruzi TaxID=5693 RepID=Q4D5M1_TRYCC|nr:hypothetical protein, conserved [Trypanosoma cruzi]EAN87822.1 hypothetical protein, conserved [Trypanosoma cruzi]|eukprot:XP_809673.1 hypothetical protein [Trypanosoma cruzi strain CL Brener]
MPVKRWQVNSCTSNRTHCSIHQGFALGILFLTRYRLEDTKKGYTAMKRIVPFHSYMLNAATLDRLVGGMMNRFAVTSAAFAVRVCSTQPPFSTGCTVEELQKSAAEFFERGEFMNAIKQWESVIESMDKADNNNNNRQYVLMSCLNNLACAYGEIGNYARKLQLLERSRDMVEQVYGRDHPQYGMVLYNIASAYEEMGRYQEMEDLLLKSLDIHERKFHSKHAKVGRVLLLLAEAHGHLGKHGAQLQVAERALEIVRRHCGPEHIQTTIALLTFSRAHGANGNHAKRLQIAQQAYDIQERKLGALNPQIALTLLELADAHGANRDYFHQKDLLEKAIELQKRAFGSQHTQLVSTYTALGDAYGNLDDRNNQFASYREALDIARQRYRGNHIVIGTASNKCAWGYLRIGKVEEAKTLAEEARRIIEGMVSEKHPAAVELRATLQELKRVTGGTGKNA